MSYPPRYYEGLTPNEIEARRLQFSIQAELPSSDPLAYRPAVGDDRESASESAYTLRYRGLYGEERQSNPLDSASPPAWLVGLEKKAAETGCPLWALVAVYRRGLAAWRTGHRPGVNAFAWGMARVNSFLVGGKTYHGPDRDIAKAANWHPLTTNKIPNPLIKEANPSPNQTKKEALAVYPWLSVREVDRWIPMMLELGVSEVALSDRGFFLAYMEAGTARSLPVEWIEKRNAYVARRKAQIEKQNYPLYFDTGINAGLPTRAHLSLISWAYTPDPTGLRASYRKGKDRLSP